MSVLTCPTKKTTNTLHNIKSKHICVDKRHKPACSELKEGLGSSIGGSGPEGNLGFEDNAVPDQQPDKSSTPFGLLPCYIKRQRVRSLFLPSLLELQWHLVAHSLCLEGAAEQPSPQHGSSDFHWTIRSTGACLAVLALDRLRRSGLVEHWKRCLQPPSSVLVTTRQRIDVVCPTLSN